MTAFKNRNGNTSPALHNQADLSQRRRGRNAAQQTASATPAQSPAAPAIPPAVQQAVAEPAAGARRRRQQPPAPATPQVSTPVQAPAAQTLAQTQTQTPASSARRRQQTQPATIPAPAVAAPAIQATSQPAAPKATNPATVSPQQQTQLKEERKERRQIRVAAPNMTWKSLADVPKPDGPLNTQMLQVARLIEVGIELAGMVEDENLQMAQGHVHMLSDHQAHKSELSSAYIQTMNSLRAHPPSLKKDNMPMIQFMKEVAARVQTALDTHMSMCRAAMSMTEQLIGKIRKDVAAHDGQNLQYKNPMLGSRARRNTQERVSAVAHNSLV